MGTGRDPGCAISKRRRTLAPAASLPLRAEKTLEEIASFPNQQVTGVTVSLQGGIFVNFPFWSYDHTTSVAEIVAAFG